MKTQVVVIHGADAFETYEEYIAALQQHVLDFGTVQGKGWKVHLEERLGDAYEVIRPSMPNKGNARYREWKIWFKKYIPYLRDGVILIGHSMGGIFLAKFLEEEKLPITVRATLLVAPPYDEETASLVDFVLPTSLTQFAEQGGAITLFFSKDDPVVPFNALRKYTEALPQAKEMVFEHYGHFNTEEFPELVDVIKQSS